MTDDEFEIEYEYIMSNIEEEDSVEWGEICDNLDCISQKINCKDFFDDTYFLEWKITCEYLTYLSHLIDFNTFFDSDEDNERI